VIEAEFIQQTAETAPSIGRTADARRFLVEACKRGVLRTGARGIDGGRIHELDAGVWLTEEDKWARRFDTCRINVADPYGGIPANSASAWTYIYVHADDLQKLLSPIRKATPSSAVSRGPRGRSNAPLVAANTALDDAYPEGIPARDHPTIRVKEIIDRARSFLPMRQGHPTASDDTIKRALQDRRRKPPRQAE